MCVFAMCVCVCVCVCVVGSVMYLAWHTDGHGKSQLFHNKLNDVLLPYNYFCIH